MRIILNTKSKDLATQEIVLVLNVDELTRILSALTFEICGGNGPRSILVTQMMTKTSPTMFEEVTKVLKTKVPPEQHTSIDMLRVVKNAMDTL